MKKFLFLILCALINFGVIYFILFYGNNFEIINIIKLTVITLLFIKDFFLIEKIFISDFEKESKYKKIHKILNEEKEKEMLVKNEKLKIITYLEKHNIEYDEDFIEFILK